MLIKILQSNSSYLSELIKTIINHTLNIFKYLHGTTIYQNKKKRFFYVREMLKYLIKLKYLNVLYYCNNMQTFWSVVHSRKHFSLIKVLK